MATLTNPVNPGNIVSRYIDWVPATANGYISWGTNAKPFAEMADGHFGGTTAGKALSISGGNLGSIGNLVGAAAIYNALVNETVSYTNIRNLRALLFVDGGGGNTGTRGTAGYVYDQTAVAHLNTGYRAGIGSPPNAGVAANNKIGASELENFFSNLRNSYNSIRGSTVTIQTNVCHASCHSSCHGSRGRR